MHRYFTGLVFLALISAGGNCFSQAFSPYSRFGLGYMPDDIPSATRAMGGFSTGYSSAFHINHSNPASYADLALTTFEVGANVDGGSVHTKDSVYNGVNGTVSNVQLGIPLIRSKLGISFGLIPYSFVNYSIASTQVDTSYLNNGLGSLYQAYFGAAYKIKDFAFGVNAGYLFGNMTYTRGYQFPDSVGAYNIQDISTTFIHGFTYNVGLMYHKRILKKTPQNSLKSDIIFTIGVQGNSNINVNTRVTSQWQRYTGTFPQVTIDTPLNYADRIGKITLPYDISGGFTLGNENWWIVGLDFKYTGSWVNDQFADFGQTTASYQSAIPEGNNWSTGSSWMLRLGGGIVPDNDSRSFFSRIQYKVGAYYGKSDIIYHPELGDAGTHLSQYGGTFGFSVPLLFSGIYREAAHFHFTSDIGIRTPGNSNLITENYYRFNFGFTLNNVWFVKRKFD